MFEIRSWCSKNKGERFCVDFSKSSEPLQYGRNYIDLPNPITCIDQKGKCVRMAFANALYLIHKRDSARNYWYSQPKFDRKKPRERAYRRSVNKIRKLESHVEAFVPGALLRHIKLANGGGIRDPHIRFFFSGSQRGIVVVTMRDPGICCIRVV